MWMGIRRIRRSLQNSSAPENSEREVCAQNIRAHATARPASNTPSCRAAFAGNRFSSKFCSDFSSGSAEAFSNRCTFVFLLVSAEDPITIGMDVGNKSSRYCVLDGDGAVLATTRAGMKEKFAGLGSCRIALEVGTHSAWLARWLASFRHEVIVANPRQMKLISSSSRKDDRMDAQTLARLARVDPALLRPIRHRGEQAQEHLRLIRVRATLVETRTALVNAARGFRAHGLSQSRRPGSASLS
jgi:Transposase